MFTQSDFRLLNDSEVKGFDSYVNSKLSEECFIDTKDLKILYETRGLTTVCILQVSISVSQLLGLVEKRSPCFFVGASKCNVEQGDYYSQVSGMGQAFSKAMKDLLHTYFIKNKHFKEARKFAPKNIKKYTKKYAQR